MRRLNLLICMLTLPAMLLVGTGYSQDKKDAKKDEQPPTKGQLPKGWGKIGIGEIQRQKILDLIRPYETKIDALQLQIEKLQTEKMTEAYKLLNDAQKEELRLQKEAKADKKDKDKKLDDKRGIDDDKKDDKKKG